jgi:hypothetical protein
VADTAASCQRRFFCRLASDAASVRVALVKLAPADSRGPAGTRSASTWNHGNGNALLCHCQVGVFKFFDARSLIPSRPSNAATLPVPTGAVREARAVPAACRAFPFANRHARLHGADMARICKQPRSAESCDQSVKCQKVSRRTALLHRLPNHHRRPLRPVSRIRCVRRRGGGGGGRGGGGRGGGARSLARPYVHRRTEAVGWTHRRAAAAA